MLVVTWDGTIVAMAVVCVAVMAQGIVMRGAVARAVGGRSISLFTVAGMAGPTAVRQPDANLNHARKRIGEMGMMKSVIGPISQFDGGLARQ